MSHFQVDALEHDALQVLNLVRSMKNSLALINKIPPDVLFLIPNYWEDSNRDTGLINLTHVCHSWRELFISCPLLWACLDCASVDKTKTYIERSKSSPLEIYLQHSNNPFHQEEALILAATHVGRLRTISAEGGLTQVFTVLAKHFSGPTPHLKKLDVRHVRYYGPAPTLPNELLNGDLPSLRELCLIGVITSLPWRGLSNLITFTLGCDEIPLTHLLDFFESSPSLRHIYFNNSIPDSSNPPAKRLVSLPNLKDLSVIAQPAPSILLNHLSIPTGASLSLVLTHGGNESPILSGLPKSLKNLKNLSHINAINLCLGSGQRSVRLNGPSGGLYIRSNWTPQGGGRNSATDRFLRSVDKFDLSRSQRLAVMQYNDRPQPATQAVTYALYQIIHPMEDLRILTLTQCNNPPFILTLNPTKNPDGIVLCHKLEEITFYIERSDQLRLDELLSMAKERALRGAKLSGITVVSQEKLLQTGWLYRLRKTWWLFRLRKHVSHVEYKVDDAVPAWDALPGMKV